MKKASLVLKKTGGPIEITGLLYPLKDNNGVVFPYTPTIMFSHAAGYGQYDITGANYHQNYYTIYTKRASHLLLLWIKNLKLLQSLPHNY